MRRRKAIWAGLLLIVLLGLVLAGIGLALKQEPEFYTRDGIVAPQAEDPHQASLAQTKLLEIQNAIGNPRPASGEWLLGLSHEELNAFLREDESSWNAVGPKLAPLHDLRVSLDGDVLTLAARYGQGFWSTAVWMEARMWLVTDEPNLIALELVSLRAGAIPLNKNWLMDWLSRVAVKQGAELAWYRGDENPVGILRLRAKLSQPDMLLTVLNITQGQINIGGKALLGP